MAINYEKLRKDLETERKKVQTELEKAKEQLEKARQKVADCNMKVAELRAKNTQLKTIQDNLPIEAFINDSEPAADAVAKIEVEPTEEKEDEPTPS